MCPLFSLVDKCLRAPCSTSHCLQSPATQSGLSASQLPTLQLKELVDRGHLVTYPLPFIK